MFEVQEGNHRLYIFARLGVVGNGHRIPDYDCAPLWSCGCIERARCGTGGFDPVRVFRLCTSPEKMTMHVISVSRDRGICYLQEAVSDPFGVGTKCCESHNLDPGSYRQPGRQPHNHLSLHRKRKATERQRRVPGSIFRDRSIITRIPALCAAILPSSSGVLPGCCTNRPYPTVFIVTTLVVVPKLVTFTSYSRLCDSLRAYLERGRVGRYHQPNYKQTPYRKASRAWSVFVY